MRRGIFRPPGADRQSKSRNPLGRRPVGRGTSSIAATRDRSDASRQSLLPTHRGYRRRPFGRARDSLCPDQRALQYPPPSVGGDDQPYPRRAQPKTAVPMEPDEGISGSSSEPLSHQLSRSGGVIHPPVNVDPGITQPAPHIGPHSMPVIPPPDTPGGNPEVKPK